MILTCNKIHASVKTHSLMRVASCGIREALALGKCQHVTSSHDLSHKRHRVELRGSPLVASQRTYHPCNSCTTTNDIHPPRSPNEPQDASSTNPSPQHHNAPPPLTPLLQFGNFIIMGYIYRILTSSSVFREIAPIIIVIFLLQLLICLYFPNSDDRIC